MTYASSKGQLGMEVAWVVLVLVVIGIGFLFAYPAFKEINDDIQADTTMSAVAKENAQTVVGNYASNMDGAYFFMFMLLWIFLVIAGYFANNQPVWLVVTIIFVVCSLVATMFLANGYEELSADGEISSFTDEFPKMSWILEHLLLVMVMMGFSVVAVMYVRS